MTARFRPVWLVLDPFTGGRAVLGMLVDDRGRVEFVSAADAGRGLSPTQQNIVDVAAAELAQPSSFAELPAGLGPLVVLGEARAVPAGVDAPARWVAEHVLRNGRAA